MLTRREMLVAAGSASAFLAARTGSAQPMAVRPMPNMGGAPAGFPMRSRQSREGNQPFDFLGYCRKLGFGIAETRTPPGDPAEIRKFRDRVESFQMRTIMDVPLPRSESDVPNFDAALKNVKEAGAYSLHTAMTQRRYEQFDNFDAFKKDFERCQKMVALAEPVLRKYRIRLGIENHKGWRSAEQAAWLKRLASEWVGVHFDFGNNIALCEVPSETLDNLVPYVVACHIKDMAVEPYEDGFLLSEVPLGEGCLDLKGMVAAIQKKDPNTPFDLEMITRDPLKIPIFTDKYWATFDDPYSPLPGHDLSRIFVLVNKNHPKHPLPRTTGMSLQAQLALEDDNVNKSIAYAREQLGL